MDNRQLIVINKIIPAALGALAFFMGMRHYDVWYVVIPIIAVKNLFFGVFDAYNSVVSTEMIGDTVDYMEWKTGMRNEGMDDDRRLNAERLEEAFYGGKSEKPENPSPGDIGVSDEAIELAKAIGNSPELMALLKGLLKNNN